MRSPFKCDSAEKPKTNANNKKEIATALCSEHQNDFMRCEHCTQSNIVRIASHSHRFYITVQLSTAFKMKFEYPFQWFPMKNWKQYDNDTDQQTRALQVNHSAANRQKWARNSQWCCINHQQTHAVLCKSEISVGTMFGSYWASLPVAFFSFNISEWFK